MVAEPQIVLRISRLAKCVSERFATRCYDAIMGGVVFTAEERLRALRHEGLPWDEAVGFDHSSALSLDTLPRDAALQGAIFYVNGEERARINIAEMRFTADSIVGHLSEAMTLRIGDLIFLGSPAKIEVKAGDNYRLVVGDKVLLDFDIK
jgi:2-keto-4-pentenoate hydratase/2-oxohepta-3-ene-1,7-dioic acid hydratase in catechol pathway